jgi:hypothetical protein
MNDLLQLAVAAHGGTRRWCDFFKLEAVLSVGGTLSEARAEPDLPQAVRLVADLYQPRVVWSPQPQEAHTPLATDAAWGPAHTAWFSGDAAWSYLIQPFLYTYPGFSCTELEPWEENGEQWRRLKIAFPEHLASHGSEQVAYFGREGLLRRHDYQLGAGGGQAGVACASYASDYCDADGIRVPTRRRIYARDDAGQRRAQAPLLAIDVEQIAFA